MSALIRTTVLAVLLAAVGNHVAVAQDLLDCGVSRYYYADYSCFDDTFLCPVQSGVRTLRCGDACYNPNEYTCSNTTLEFYNPDVAGQLFDCGDSRYDPSAYVCYDGDFLCPKSGTVPTLPCDTACYAPDLYTCTDGQLSPNPGPADCVPNFGASQACNDQGCFQLTCCPGLISIGDKCRDPCDFTHDC